MSNSKKTSPQQLTVRIKDCKNSGDLHELLSQQGATFDHIHVSAAWSKFKSMQRRVDKGTLIDLVRMLQELTESQMPKMDGRGVSNILHAIAKAKAADTASMKQLVQKLMANAASVLQSFDPQDVANTVWALATMGVTPEAGLLRAMQGRATAVAGEFNPQEVANTVWALATMGVTPEAGLLRAMQGRATALAGEFKPQAVANTVWALATMGVTPEAGLLRAMQGRATALAGEFKPQAVANTLWAHTCLGIPCGKREQELFEILANRLLEMTSTLDVEDECQLHQWLLTFDLEPSWDLSSLVQVNVVKQQLGERCRRSFVVQDPNPSDLQVHLALIAYLTLSDRSLA
jgi:predicted small integral membrane protein